ncbi:31108_t:CDS:1, partial [Racocetra persica]
AKAMPRFFELMNEEDFNLFLNTISDGEFKKFSMPNDTDDAVINFEEGLNYYLN